MSACLPKSASTFVTIIFCCAFVLGGCSKTPPAPIELRPQTANPTTTFNDDNADDEAPTNAVPPPAGATVGEVVAPLPRAAPRLFDGTTTAIVLPDISCEELTPDNDFKLAHKLEVVSLASNKGDADQTLELCLFNRWLQRTDSELPQRTGRKHHFVAAFPGTNVASWTTREVQRTDLGLPDAGGSGLGAGWAAVIATGVPKWPAVGVVSARFYAGELGEEVHYMRRARVLLEDGGRWLWKPLVERSFATLDRAWLTKACEAAVNSDTSACAGAAERIARYAKQADSRAAVRRAMLTGAAAGKKSKTRRKKSKKRNKPARYGDDSDPQASWLRDGRLALKARNSKLAIRNALRTLAVCGEYTKEAAALIREANKRTKTKTPRIQPLQQRPQLCEPLPDKQAPKDRKR